MCVCVHVCVRVCVCVCACVEHPLCTCTVLLMDNHELLYSHIRVIQIQLSHHYLCTCILLFYTVCCCYERKQRPAAFEKTTKQRSKVKWSIAHRHVIVTFILYFHTGLLAGLWEFPSVELTNHESSDRETWEKIPSSFLTDTHLITDSIPLGKVRLLISVHDTKSWHS